MADFMHALDEVKPAFGANMESLSTYIMHDMMDYGDAYHHLHATLGALVKQVGPQCSLTCITLGPRRILAGAWPTVPGSEALSVFPLLLQVATSDKTPLLSVLLEGPVGAGKSALAASLALESGFPYIKVIGPEQMVCVPRLALPLRLPTPPPPNCFSGMHH